MAEASAPGPFAGLKVVELGRFIAAPYCAQLLADGGADVIKVEPLEGDATRFTDQVIPGEARQYLNKNRGKRSLAVDLGDPEARSAVQRLAHAADVVVVNFRPGEGQKLGLDYASISAANPRVVYAENTGFGDRGPMAAIAGMDIALQAYSGLAHIDALGPTPLGNPIIDYTAALLLAWGISTALYQRERSGRGQKLNVALLQAALVAQNNTLNHIDAIDGWQREYVGFARKALAEGRSWAEILEHKRQIRPHAAATAYYGFFPTADGMIAIAGAGRPNQKRVLEVLGLEDPWVTSPGWLPEDAHAHVTAMRVRVEEKLRERPTADWIAVMRAAGLPVAPLQLTEEVLEDEQVWANEFLVRLEHEAIGGLTVVAPPVRFSETPLRAERASPTLGRDSRAILAEAGLDAAAIERLVAQGAVRTG